MPEEQDKSSKTEEPTEKRLREAHKEGNFAKAEEIQVVFGLAAAFVVVLFQAGEVGRSLALLMAQVLGHLGDYTLNNELVVFSGRLGVATLGLGLLPVFLGAVIASILAGGLQSGFRLTPKVLKVNPGKLNPVKGIQQKYGMQALFKFGIDFLKFLVMGMVIFLGVLHVTRHPIFHTRIEAMEVGEFIYETTLLLLALLITALAFVALINYLYQKNKTRENLKMTKQEVKDERKQQEGDPQVRTAQRQRAHALAQRQMFAAIPQADVIVTNPTHYAVALRYDRTADAAPVVLAMGRNLIAHRIKEIGRESGVPLVENKPLAQALYKIGKTGQSIPPQLYRVVADVLAYVYRRDRHYFKRRRSRQERAL